MLSYILKRIALMLPTLLGVLTLTFVVIQFVPGGPVDQVLRSPSSAYTRELLEAVPEIS